MAIHRDLAVLDAAEQVVADVVKLVDSKRRRLLFKAQLRDSAQSVTANIGEGFGRATRADRNRTLLIARGEAEETIRHLRTNFVAKRIDDAVYWRLHNRLVTIVKMLNSLAK
jgi:four helix bundle protein